MIPDICLLRAYIASHQCLSLGAQVSRLLPERAGSPRSQAAIDWRKTCEMGIHCTGLWQNLEHGSV